MKHYKNANNELFGFEDDQEVPEGLVEISKFDAEVQGKLNYEAARVAEIANLDYVRQRVLFYPNLGEFADAWVKGDEAALEAYRQECLAVKARFPKPEGF